MPSYVAFLRAINLGGRRAYPKDAIRHSAEAAGFTDVRTYINTGNVHVTAPLRSRAKVEQALEAAFLADRGFEVPTIAFRTDELRSVAEAAADLAARHPGTGSQHVTLLKDEPDAAAVAAVEALGEGGERVVVTGRAVHLLPGGFADSSRSIGGLDRYVGVATTRTRKVIETLAERWC